MNWLCLFRGHAPHRIPATLFVICKRCGAFKRIPLPIRAAPARAREGASRARFRPHRQDEGEQERGLVGGDPVTDGSRFP